MIAVRTDHARPSIVGHEPRNLELKLLIKVYRFTVELTNDQQRMIIKIYVAF